MLSVPELPWKIRVGNGVARALQPLGLQRRALQKDDLLETAMRRTGLDDFGDPGFEQGLDRLLPALRDEARLTPLGTLIAREETLTPLVNRLQLVDHHKRFPEIGQAPITAPIFIIGMGRSGTTVLHELLALDPQFRVPQTWEVDHPFPAPESATYTSDARIEQTAKMLARTEDVIPGFKRIHRTGAQLPQECVRFTTGEFLSLIFWTNYDVPSYSDWLRDVADLRGEPVWQAECVRFLLPVSEEHLQGSQVGVCSVRASRAFIIGWV